MILRPNQFIFSSDNSQLLRSVLNEVLNGFAVENLDGLTGMNRSELQELLTSLNKLPNEREAELNLNQTEAFRNALRETLSELGIEEFHTRTGFDFEEGKEILEELDRLIQSVDERLDE